MSQSDGPAQEIAGPRDRLSRLSAASLRINANLDFDRVLQEVLDSARDLAGARYGIITTLDQSGEAQEVVTSGLTKEEHRGLQTMPGGLRIFEYLSRLPEALRVEDLSSHLKALGVPEFHPPVPVNSFLAAPMHHRAAHVGTFYLAEKEDGPEFTIEDEETLVMFAAQAGLVVSNARTHREELRAKADLETLIHTSPVGIVVFDARTGGIVSVNREARRVVIGLRTPGSPLEQLLETLVVRRADGRETALSEVSLPQALQAGETVRAEEVTLQVPNGRSVRVLLNATPVRSRRGEVDSFIVTLQDTSPLEELERLRAELLAMASHELRRPLTSIRGSVTALLDHSSGLNPAEMGQYHRIILDQADRMQGLLRDLLDVAHIETGTLSVDPELADVAGLVDDARKTFLSSGGRHRLQLDIPPDLPPVMADRGRVVQVLGNLLSNAARHSEESTAVGVTASHEDTYVSLSVVDEGEGVPAERLPHLFRKFFRDDSKVQKRDLSGSGLGLAICRGIVEAHGGRVWAESEGPGLGTRFTFTLPVAQEEEADVAAGPGRSVANSLGDAGEPARILVVDDDPQVLSHVRQVLSKAGYAPVVTGEPNEALRAVGEGEFQLVLLDLMLPGTGGIELMRAILETRDVPVIFLSAYGQDQVVARAFDLGAADYVVKPFSPTELAARIRAVLRRQTKLNRADKPQPFQLGDLLVDFDRRRVTVAGRHVELTATEYRLLVELSVNAGRVLTYRHLLAKLWGIGQASDPRPLRTAVKSLRRKLGDNASDPTYIFTEYRIGYRMEAPD